jgi:predicted DNA-binding transcriptional regulator AlpA|tara:strand:+ start:887 stop:1090 length:204 start_codon:yes stop_codon:yes gene_type:complete
MKYYKPVDVASMLNLTTQTLMLWRKKGIGPQWIKLGQNIVRYPMTNFDEWMNDRHNQSTQQTNNSTR